MSAFNTKHIILATSALSLAACGSATTGTSNAPFQASAATNANAKIKTVNELLANGETLTGKGARVVSATSGAGKHFSTNNSLALKKLSGDKYEFTVGTEKFEVDASDFDKDAKMYKKVLGNGRTVLLTTGSKSGKSAGYDYVDFISVLQAIEVNGLATELSQQFATIGNKTQNMSTLEPKATYAGRFATFMKGTAKGITTLEGDVNLDVNFADNSLTGNFSNIIDSSLTKSDKSVAGKFDITNGTIKNNGYSAKLVADADVNAYMKTDVRGDINGSFYGANAEETGGDLTFMHGDTFGTGAFAAKKQ